jgi:phosphoenolpyruvate-protein phosphotransferase (PTS system enzyme I)
MELIKGIPVAPGVVIARAFVLDEGIDRVPFRQIAAGEVALHLERLTAAIDAAAVDIAADRDRASAKLGPEPAKIFEFHLGLMRDKTLIQPIRDRIAAERVSAEYATAEAFRGLAQQFRAMNSDVFRQKAADVMDLDYRILSKLRGESEDRLAKIHEPVIVVAHELTPAQASAIGHKEHVAGIATDAGGRTSHSSIVAASLGIPVVVGCQRLTQFVSEGDLLVVDGKSGVVIVRPDADTLSEYRKDVERMVGYQAGLRELVALPSITLDGTMIELLGNIEFPYEAEDVLEFGGDGVGLYRTEFLHLTSPTEPGELEHFMAYKTTLELLGGRPLTIRTLDLGADKYTQTRAEDPERNPFLGLRSIRYSLQNLGMFKTQLRAIMRASALGPIKIMFPLVSTVQELRQAKMVLNDVMEELEEENVPFDRAIPVGMMVEVPSAALMAPTFAREVSFFSIGTNDLIQYTLAVDRGNERVANLYSGASPAVLQLVKNVIRTGKRFRVPTSLCGEIAGDPLFTILLIGLGLRTLSLVPSQIPRVKRVIRSVDIGMCERLARRVGSFDSERKVMNCLRDALTTVSPELDSGWPAV